MGWGFITEYADGEAINSYPDPGFGKQSERVFELITVKHVLEFAVECINLYSENENDITAWGVLICFAMWGIEMALGIE